MAPNSRGPKIMVLGTRGCPDVQGGIERHVEALAPRLVARGFDVEVIGRRPYLTGGARNWRGVRVVPTWAPRRKSLETIVHTGLGIARAVVTRPDLIHIHGIGPALLAPLARLAGLRVAITHHGYNYEHAKWGGFARKMLRWGEAAGMATSQVRIAVSSGIAGTMSTRYGKSVTYVPNGVEIDATGVTEAALAPFGLTSGRYVLSVARLVPEKRLEDLVAAYGRLRHPDFKLVIVGGADRPDDYETGLRAQAAATPGVVMTGFQSGAALASLYAHAGLFVLPSSHEAMPIALLEAMAHGLPVLASDIAANLEFGLDAEDYFALGDTEALAGAMQRKMAAPVSAAQRQRQSRDVAQRYGWDKTADAVAALFSAALPGRRQPGEQGVAHPAE